jgi:hypothetical protein
MMGDLDNDFSEGDIHFRDSLQFELKSEFFINPSLNKNIYSQEFYLFIPNTLQVNRNTYSKSQFYLDQTNLIRYKTPRISLSELIQSNNSKSPLIRLQSKRDLLNKQEDATIKDELKLFGNIFKRALHDRVHYLLTQLNHVTSEQKYHLEEQIKSLDLEIERVRLFFINTQAEWLDKQTSPTLTHFFKYTDEFNSLTIEYYLTLLLNRLKNTSTINWEKTEKSLCETIVNEQQYREKHELGPKTPTNNPFFQETILYRQSLLNKFMLEALQLESSRFSLEEKHGNLLGATSAGIAMLIYMVLFWKTSIFSVNSLPFVLLIVVFYILKDRVKEGIKTLYYKQAYRWFPDYATGIKSPKGHPVGLLTENFAFIDKIQLNPNFLKLRNKGFHEELEAMQRPETIMQYKRQVTLYSQPPPLATGRRQELTTTFRFNIHRFLEKANDALQLTLQLNPETRDVKKNLLPKVYHLNIIIQNIYLKSNLEQKKEIKKFRVIVDKNGIKRVEQIP